MTSEIFESKDKQLVPYLLIQPGINFLGTRANNFTVFFQFSPKENCIELSNRFISRTAPLVQAKELLDAVETFRDRIFEMKEKMNYGGH